MIDRRYWQNWTEIHIFGLGFGLVHEDGRLLTADAVSRFTGRSLYDIPEEEIEDVYEEAEAAMQDWKDQSKPHIIKISSSFEMVIQREQ